MSQTTHDVFEAVRSGWPQILAIVAVIWWSRKIDLRTQEHADRLDRHDRRIVGVEQEQQTQAIQLARMEEMLSSMKLTLDRIYNEMRAGEGRGTQ